MDRIHLLIWASALIDAAAGVTAVVWVGRGRVEGAAAAGPARGSAGRVVVAGLALAALVFVKLAVLRRLGLERGQAPPVRLLAPPEVSLLRVG